MLKNVFLQLRKKKNSSRATPVIFWVKDLENNSVQSPRIANCTLFYYPRYSRKKGFRLRLISSYFLFAPWKKRLSNWKISYGKKATKSTRIFGHFNFESMSIYSSVTQKWRKKRNTTKLLHRRDLMESHFSSFFLAIFCVTFNSVTCLGYNRLKKTLYEFM